MTERIEDQGWKVIPQDKDHNCGPFKAEMILYRASILTSRARMGELEELLSTTIQEGTSEQAMERFFRERSVFEAKVKTWASVNDLKKETDSGRACIVAFQNWEKPSDEISYEWGHYASVYRVDNDSVYMIDPDPENGIRAIPITEFQRRWIDLDLGKIYYHWMISIKV